MTQEPKSFVSGKSVGGDNFSSALTYLITTVGCAVGFGNVWRFPYLVYTYGGLAFILVYLVVLVIITYPIMILEMGLGQLLRGGQVQAWSKMGRRIYSPGLATWTSFTVCLFYPMLLAWSLIFFVNSFSKQFGWSNPPGWKESCSAEKTETNCTQFDYCVWRNNTFCAMDSLHNSEIFFREKVYAFKDFENRDRDLKLEGISGAPILGLFVTWTLNVLCVFAGAKILGYSTYLTMSLPAIFLIVLVGISSSLEGAGDGIADYILKFKIEKFTAQMLIDAITQSIFSASLGQGVISSLSAHNSVHDNFAKNALVVLIADTFFAFIAGFAVFAMTGFLASQSQVKIEELPLSGISLAFTAYPAALSQIPGAIANVTAALFFLTLWLVGFSTIVTLTEALVLTTIVSSIGRKLRLKRWHATVAFSLFFFLVPGVLLSTNIGFALLDSIDNYNAMGQGFAAGFQAVCVGWFYLSKYSTSKVGSKAYWIHAITFFAGPFYLGLLDNVSAIAAIILGLSLPILGFALALYLCKETDDDGQVLSTKDKAFYLSVYNVLPLRKAFNDAACTTGRIRVPYIWTWSIKYLVPFVTMYLTVSSLTDASKMFDRPDANYPYPWYVFFIGQISPFLMIITMLVALVYPKLMTPLLPDKDFEGRSVFGEKMIAVFDRHKPEGQLTASHINEEEIELEVK